MFLICLRFNSGIALRFWIFSSKQNATTVEALISSRWVCVTRAPNTVSMSRISCKHPRISYKHPKIHAPQNVCFMDAKLLFLKKKMCEMRIVKDFMEANGSWCCNLDFRLCVSMHELHSFDWSINQSIDGWDLLKRFPMPNQMPNAAYKTFYSFVLLTTLWGRWDYGLKIT